MDTQQPMNTETEIRVGIGVVRRGDLFLVGVRAGERALAGCAEFPGGKLEPEESVEACVAREVSEETGLRVRTLPWRRIVPYEYAHGRVLLTFLLCEPLEDTALRPPFGLVHRDDLAGLTCLAGT